jgi:hypothetical protein
MQPHRIGTWALSLLVAVGLFGGTGGAWGQEQSGDVSRFGTETEMAHVVTAAEFTARTSNFAWGFQLN